MLFFAPHVFMDVAELMHFTDDDIGFVIKVGNGGGVTKVVSERCGEDRPKDGGMNEGHFVVVRINFLLIRYTLRAHKTTKSNVTHFGQSRVGTTGFPLVAEASRVWSIESKKAKASVQIAKSNEAGVGFRGPRDQDLQVYTARGLM